MHTIAQARRSVEEARVGDWLEVAGSPIGASPRRGEIIEILGHPEHLHFRVRWDESHESLVYPEHGAALVHPNSRAHR